MENLDPKPGVLSPIESASRDEISALQLKRMKSTLLHAYNNSPFYQKQFTQHGVCLLYTSPSPRDGLLSRMPSSA